jgi:hypothetical protein
MSYPAQQGFPQGYPPQQGYPQQGQPQQFAPAQQYAPPQNYQPGYPPQQMAPPGPRGTIDDFYDQPAASGKSIASWFQTPGQSITGMIARQITNADTRPQTDMQTKQPKYYSDGRPMLTMTIPLMVAPTPDFPDGRAAWIISSSDKEDLDLAMQAAGCKPRTVPEAGATITITFTGFKQIPGFGAPKKVKQITYQRPAGAVSAPEPAAQPAPVQAAQDMVSGNGQAPQAPPQQPPWQAPEYTPPVSSPAPAYVAPQPSLSVAPAPAYVPPSPQYVQQAAPAPHPQMQMAPVAPAQVPQAPAQEAPQAPAQAAPQAAPGAPMSMPAGLTPEQQAKLAQLTGNPPQ